ncbi:MAG: hypothetical protein DDT21_01331 [Syntrophomonadaceae bacterium]|nr:hypothetical protein [Bacillota bacterium]
MERLAIANRLYAAEGTLRYIRFVDDFPSVAYNSAWMDIGGVQSRSDPKVYVVQTATEAVKRCLLMTTDPGDLVFDPTCCSGTTAFVAEQWGWRWITCDTSRVALTLARQRLMTAVFDYYELSRPPHEGVKYRVSVHGFDYYNTKTGVVESGGGDKIAVWLLDTDYDGRSLYPRQVFFPMVSDKEGWARLAKNLKAEIDEELIEAYRGTVSLPFEPGPHKRIAVKIVDDRGIESLKVLEVE